GPLRAGKREVSTVGVLGVPDGGCGGGVGDLDAVLGLATAVAALAELQGTGLGCCFWHGCSLRGLTVGRGSARGTRPRTGRMPARSRTDACTGGPAPRTPDKAPRKRPPSTRPAGPASETP